MKRIVIIFFVLSIYSCSNAEYKEAKLKKMFIKAMKNNSSAPNFVVINVIDLRTNERKDLCSEGTELSYVLHLDSQELNFSKLNYTNYGIPIIKLKTEQAIEQIGFRDYNTAIVDSLIRNTDNSLINEILKQSKNDGYSKLLEINSLKFNKKYFEHYLYMNGIPTYRDCESGYTVIDSSN
jgi:ribosomal protein L39E